MKITLISEYNMNTSVGGTEAYVDMLIKGLLSRKHEVILVTLGKHTTGQPYTEWHKSGQYQYKCFYLAKRSYSREELMQKKVSSTWKEIEQILMQEAPEIIHVHTYTTFFNIRHFEKCKENFRHVFFTSHVPAHFCPKGDLIKYNQKPCDGILSFKCSVCLFTKSIRNGMSNILSGYTRKVHDRLRILNELAVRLICVSDWQKEHAISNGFPSGKISVIRQALVTADYKVELQQEEATTAYTIGYLGRLSAEKGSALLFRLVSEILKQTNFRFVLGIPIMNSDPADVARLKVMINEYGDRITIMDHINSSNKELFFNSINHLIIPSFCIETGPIVLLEAILFHKRVTAPDTGGPSGFKQDFPQQIDLYKWNNVSSAIQSLLRNRDAAFSNDNFFDYMKTEESLFAVKHEELYKKELNV